MTRLEKIYAVARFSIYLGVLLAIVQRDTKYLYYALVAVLFMYFLTMYLPPVSDEATHTNQTGGGGDGVKFQHPTDSNPFMNVLLTDYVDRPERPPAADVTNPIVKEEIKDAFSTNLYRDIDDVWDRNNSQRQYYTNPATTIPNDRDSFMNWCWKVPAVCKDGDLGACLKYEDPRGHGQII